MLGGRRVLRCAAVVLAAVGPGACSFIATFDERPPADDAGGAGAGAAGQGGGAVGLVAAYPLATCMPPPDASPLDPAPCGYRDESCSGFPDLGHGYVEKVTAIADGSALACDVAALVAYEVAADAASGREAEIRVLAREREEGGACPTSGAPGSQRLVLLRLDARTLELQDKTPIEIEAPAGAPAPPPADLVLGRSERRLVAAYRALDPADGAFKVFVLTLPIDLAPLSASPVSGPWKFHLAAKLKSTEAFVAARASAVDDVAVGKVYVAVESADGGPPPVMTIGDEEIGEEVPYASLLRFTDDTVQSSRAELFARATAKTDDAGLLIERIGPGAMSRTRQAPLMTVMGNQATPEGLIGVRYLVVPGAGSPTGRAEPWYAAAALFPERPANGFGVTPLHLRLEIFGFEGKTYAQLKGCAFADDTPCTLNSKTDGGAKDLDLVGTPACDAPVELVGALVPDNPDAKATTPKMHARCLLGDGLAGAGKVVWHREAGGFGAALHSGGETLWLVRPGGGALVSGDVTVTLGAALPVGAGAPLASDGPLSIAFADGLGWIVAAVERGTGRLWTRRFGCSASP